MAEEPVAERGVLIAPTQMWETAVRQAEVIGPLAAKDTVGLAEADEAAERLRVSRRQVYVLLGRWRAGEGVVSDLLPGRSSGGRGGGRLSGEVETIVQEALRTRYLTRQRRSVAAVCKEITRQCRARGLRAPSRGSMQRRIERLDPVASVSGREGREAVRPLRSAGGVPPAVTGLLEQVQVDHTPVDVIVVDERHRLMRISEIGQGRSSLHFVAS
ncbi:DNA-binding domain-containing protein [Streptomyces flaveus]|uniref:Mu DNA binding I gamma subdomain domain-containing protein n=1 Tax=Streptomyces flaveus TaxID=66370 RepID=A0A917V8S3_9ACTN|nr:DNA-binding domain-containing protein [Streptomyces flaveus]GGK52151.1 hypothetical protein GCM10010094_10640 [Streptomyces flaveus]